MVTPGGQQEAGRKAIGDVPCKNWGQWPRKAIPRRLTVAVGPFEESFDYPALRFSLELGLVFSGTETVGPIPFQKT